MVVFECDRFKEVTGDCLKISEVDSDLIVNNLYIEQSGRPIVPVIGEFHFSRYPSGLWEDATGTEHGLLSCDSGRPVLRHESGGVSTEIYLLTEEKAKTLWKLQDQVMFSDDPLLELQGSIVSEEAIAGQALDYGTADIVLSEVANETFDYDAYLFGDGTKKTYELIIPDRLMDNLDDVLIRFKLTGNAVQMYFGIDLVADWFNYDGYWSVGLKRFKSHIEGGKRCLIQVAPIGKNRPVYFERDMIREKAELEIEGIQYIKRRVLGE